MSDRFRMTLCVCPNAAHGAPHVGHLWGFAHTRYWYVLLKHLNENAHHYPCGYSQELWRGNLDLQFNCLFDTRAKPEHFDVYTKTLKWMNAAPDKIDSLSEWEHNSRASIVHLLAGDEPQLVPQWYGEYDPEGIATKFLYFNNEGVYWHLRGTDLFDHEGRERLIAHRLCLRRPKVLYFPLLLDEDGEKIDSTTVDPTYQMTDLMEQGVSAKLVIRALIKSMGIQPRIGRFREPDCWQVIEYIDQFYPSLRQTAHSHIGARLTVPRDWKRHISD